MYQKGLITQLRNELKIKKAENNSLLFLVLVAEAGLEPTTFGL